MKTVVPIQALRAVAALSVALFHFSATYWQARGHLDEGPLYPLSAGVDLFFVISGFVMVYSSELLFGSAEAPITFIRHRLARIVPIYWVTTTIAICLMREHFDFRSLLGSYFFVPFKNADGSFDPLYGIGWTLNFEVYFYSVFALCLLFTRKAALTLLAGVLLTAVTLGQIISLRQPALIIWSDPIIVEFLFGALIAVLYRGGAMLPNPLRLVMVVAAIITIWQFHMPGLPSHNRWAEWGIPAAIIVAACVLGTQRWAESWPGLAARKLGDASYSLYLLHIIVLGVTLIVANKFHTTFLVANKSSTMLIFLVMGYLGTVALSLLSYRYFERPITDLLKLKRQKSAFRRAHLRRCQGSKS